MCHLEIRVCVLGKMTVYFEVVQRLFWELETSKSVKPPDIQLLLCGVNKSELGG